MDKILLMLQLQATLNDATNGEDWRKGITKNAKEINWKRCIYMECAEMIDSFAWKHWKNIDAAPDFANLQIEVVDVWHFVMSLAMEEYDRHMLGTLEDIALNVSQTDTYAKLENAKGSFDTQSNIIAKVEDLMFITLDKEKFDIEKLIREFLELASMSGLNLETLYRLYVGKNILNRFRQDNGYKEGTYQKTWDGEEDNAVMKRIWEENGDIKPDMLYKEMAKIYFSLHKS